MISTYITPILYVSGAITASLLVQFVAPRFSLRVFNGLDVSDELTLFYARAMALPVALIGILLIWAAASPAIRLPVVAVACIGKTAFVATVLANWNTLGRGFMLTVVLDSIFAVLFALYLAGW